MKLPFSQVKKGQVSAISYLLIYYLAIGKILKFDFKHKFITVTSMAGPQLRLCTSITEGCSLIPGWETEIPLQCSTAKM